MAKKVQRGVAPCSAVSATEPGAPVEKKSRDKSKPISVFKLVILTFFVVSAGPYGVEEAISSGGALYTVISLVLIPFVMSIPLALMSAELATYFPYCGGPVEWAVDLGPFACRLNCYCRLLFSMLDNPLYAVSVLDYLSGIFPIFKEVWLRLIGSFLMFGAVALFNCLGIEIVNWLSIVISVIIISPFVIFFCGGAQYLNGERIASGLPPGHTPNWINLISTSIWLYSGYDCVGALANSVSNPRKTYPLGLIITVILVTGLYLLPVLVGVSVETNPDNWENGSFASVARKLSINKNGWLSYWISLGGVVANVAILLVAHLCASMEVYSMAKQDALIGKRYLCRMSLLRNGESVPRIAIVVFAVICFPIAALDFKILVSINGLMSMIAQGLLATSFIYARYGKRGIVRRTEEARRLMTRETIECYALSESVITPSVETISEICHTERGHEPEQDGASTGTVSTRTSLVGEASTAEIANVANSFRLPGGILIVILLAVPTFSISLFIIVISGWQSLVLTILFVAFCFFAKWVGNSIARCIEKRQRRGVRTKTTPPLNTEKQDVCSPVENALTPTPSETTLSRAASLDPSDLQKRLSA
ncbi:putative Amino acid permease [Giardia muris]|uniref:Putative Amino acid permease n=1 Tax=Giardia muris TaxID=5742 RepID=A0A4Z1SPI8_GIAMU|nr:putative Amino acid permease [Giardia muris]|eukprot:TNJ27560.1 putative Amino acid permease [Giardia muris]